MKTTTPCKITPLPLLAAILFAVFCERPCLGFYNPQTGRWLSRDPAEEEAGTDLYAAVDNDSENATDLLGLCKTCKCLNVTVNPNGPKLPMGFYYRPADIISPGGERFGAWIHIHWNLEEKSDPALCRYFINEPPGGVTGRGPDGKTPPSTGVNGEVGQDSDDPLGIPVKRAGKYRIKVNIIQTYTCVSSDGSRTTESRHFKDKAKGTYPQLVGH